MKKAKLKHSVEELRCENANLKRKNETQADSIHLAQLDQEWRHADEYIGCFVQIFSAAHSGPAYLIRHINEDPAWSVLVMKAYAIVEAQCLPNASERQKSEEP